MNASREEKMAEAVTRMKMLGVFPETIRQFREDGKVSISEPPLGAFFWMEGEDLDRVIDFEEKYNALVYVAIRSYTTVGKMDCFLFVSDYPEEWSVDREDIEQGQTLAYCFNYDMPDCSEIGAIGVAPTRAAGLRRVW